MARCRVTRVLINRDREIVTTVDAPNMEDALAMHQTIKRMDADAVVADALEEICTKGDSE